MFTIGDLNIEFRAANAADLVFVFDSWVESFRLAHAAGVIPMDMYRVLYREVIARILQRPTTRAVVAYNVAHPAQDFGYVVFEGAADPIVHYVFVKQPFRRSGLATRLLTEGGIDPKKPFTFSFKSRIAGDLTRSWSGARFDPITTRKALTIIKET